MNATYQMNKPHRAVASERALRWDVRTLPALLARICSARILVDRAIESCEIFLAVTNITIRLILTSRVVFARF